MNFKQDANSLSKMTFFDMHATTMGMISIIHIICTMLGKEERGASERGVPDNLKKWTEHQNKNIAE